jgi:hypothetical protein
MFDFTSRILLAMAIFAKNFLQEKAVEATKQEKERKEEKT